MGSGRRRRGHRRNRRGKTAARLGASTLLIERNRTGGDCLWTGCVPSKALLAAGAATDGAKRAQRLGIVVGEVMVDFAAVMEHVRSAIHHIAPVDSPAALESAGVTVWTGSATFPSQDTLMVDERTVRFRQALVATGAEPSLPPIPGLAAAPHLTSDTVWNLTDLPSRLVVLGGGAIGCELGQAFARLGAPVTIVEGAPRVLPREDGAAASLVDARLRLDGVRIVTGHSVTRVVSGEGACGELVLDDEEKVCYDQLLVAVGRSPRTRDIGLSSAGVQVDNRGFVTVDERLRTTNPRIWAAGDLTGHPQFTHTAGVHGSLAASNAVLGLTRTVSLSALPRVTFTHPEVAAVGVCTDPLPVGLRLVEWRNSHVDRAVAESDMDGFTRLAVDSRHRILGATVVGPRAGETLGELTLAVKNGLRTRDLAATTHPYPTYSDGPWNASIADARDSLSSTWVSLAVGGLTRLRRRRLDRAR
ncbi:MAG: dihydrolipoyl dehydrogenase family protein [Actinomycetales bacterium]